MKKASLLTALLMVTLMLFGCGEEVPRPKTSLPQTDETTVTADQTDDIDQKPTDTASPTDDPYVSLLSETKTTAKSYTNDEYTYTLVKCRYAPEKGYVCISEYHGDGGTVTIPETLDGYPVVVLFNKAFKGRFDVTDIQFPSTLRDVYFRDFSGGINDRLFEDTGWYQNLPDGFYYAGNVAVGHKGDIPENTTFEIREGTVSVAHTAFQFDTTENITNIVFPSTMRYLSKYALSGTSVTELTVKKEWQQYNDAFMHCRELEKVIFEEGVTETRGSFSECYELSEIVFPSTLVTIGARAFWHNPDLTSITLSDSVRTIEEYAFEGCALTQVTLNEGLYRIGEGAFADVRI